jgi:hypothetical protein
MARSRSWTLLSIAAALAVAGATDARADWPIRGHDAARTAIADRPSALALETPAITWRYYLGGSIQPGNVLALDVDGDGLRELAFLSGGKIVAKRSDDSLVWETESLSLTRLDAFTDLNGDGAPELVASGLGGIVAVVSASTGTLLWRTPVGTFGPRVGAVRVGTTGGRAFLYAADSGFSTPGNLGDVAYAWTFAADFTATRLWQLERGREFDAGIHDVVADLDGDGTSEIVAFGEHYVYLYDGATGMRVPLAGSADPDGGYPLTAPGTGAFRNPLALGQTLVADVDGDGRREIVVLSNHVYDMGTRTVFVLSYQAAAPRVVVRWHRAFARDGVHSLEAATVIDLDGDGTRELVTAYAPTGGAATTYVLDAASGAMRATMPGRLAAVYPTDVGASPLALVRNGATLDAYTFAAPIPAAPVSIFRITTDAEPAWTASLDAREEATLARRFVTFALAGGGRGMVLQSETGVEVRDPASPATAVGSYDVPAGSQPASSTAATDVAGTGERLLVSRTDGYLVVLDAALRPITFGDPDRPEIGIRTGGYYAGATWPDETAVAGRMRAAPAPDEIVVADSVGDVVRIDASSATLFEAPAVVWRWAGGVRFPSLADFDADGLLDVVGIRGGEVVVRRGDAGAGPGDLFAMPVLTGAQTFVADALPIRHPSGTRVLVEVSDTVAASVPLKILIPGSPPGSWITTAPLAAYSYFSADDLDGDGADEILAGSYSVYGSSGALLEGPNTGNATGMASRVGDGTGTTTHVSSGAVQPVTGVRIAAASPFDMTRTWQYAPAGGPVQTHTVQGVAIRCGTRWVFATGRYGTSELHLIDVADGTGRAALLGGGRVFAVGDPAFASVTSGPLTSVVGSAELSAGVPGIVVGSGDGHLYFLDPCVAPPALPAILHALELRAPVGEALFADTDGDGLDEIVVGAGDGYLYGIDEEAFPAPAEVLDVDPLTEDPLVDVDESRGVRLVAAWSEVPGATAYEWAVFTSGGTMVSRMFGRVVATEPRLARFDGPLSIGTRYFVAVRAIGPDGASSEARSDGTVYLGPPPPIDGGPLPDGGAMLDGGYVRETGPGPRTGGDCACRAGPPAGGLGALASLALVGTVLHLRRRARRS